MAESIDNSKLQTILATDCGSTTTKAILFENTDRGWRQTFRGEAPTTVEKPVADVTIGAKNAFRELEELSGRKLLTGENAPSPILSKQHPADKNGVDLYLSTSSAGGGLQMIVAGIVSSISTASAERAALGAGAIVIDSFAVDDGREAFERVQRIRHIRPDIVLLAGGTNGGSASHPLELAEMLLQADPRPRFGDTIKLPIIYAGNPSVKNDIDAILGEHFLVVHVDNLRPDLEREELAKARDAVHDLFLTHVMSHAPGYRKLMSYSPVPITPTPAAVGDMVQVASNARQQSVLAVDIGGATTDVFSVFSKSSESFDPVFHRTVSANLGMSYSVGNVLSSAGIEAIVRWLPFDISYSELENRLINKMVRPTTIPQTLEDLLVEQAVCREALRHAFRHHRRLATGLRGAKVARSFSSLFKTSAEAELVDMFKLELIIGSGGVLSHAPKREAAALMLIDSFEPLGVTELAVDSIFMMPHLGALSSVHPQAASEIFFNDCLIPLGTVIAAKRDGRGKGPMFSVSAPSIGQIEAKPNCLHQIELVEEMEVEVTPLSRDVNVGAGFGQSLKRTVKGGVAGLILDGRERPLAVPLGEERRELILGWRKQLGLET